MRLLINTESPDLYLLTVPELENLITVATAEWERRDREKIAMSPVAAAEIEAPVPIDSAIAACDDELAARRQSQTEHDDSCGEVCDVCALEKIIIDRTQARYKEACDARGYGSGHLSDQIRALARSVAEVLVGAEDDVLEGD